MATRVENIAANPFTLKLGARKASSQVEIARLSLLSTKLTLLYHAVFLELAPVHLDGFSKRREVLGATLHDIP